MKPDAAAEALRQQQMLRALLDRDAAPAGVGGLHGLGRDPGGSLGLQAYRRNAGAIAERALLAAYPTLQQLMGDEAFAALARDFWRRCPPTAGDLGEWGAELPAFIADAPTLADEPCLPDVARLEWAVHQAGRAADLAAPEGLERLATEDPAVLRMQLAPGTALLVSPHPLAAIWHAHRSDEPERFAPVRAAYGTGTASRTLVARTGWRVTVSALPEAEACLVQALLDGRSLAEALGAAGADFDFEAWLIASLRSGLIAAVTA